MKKINTGKPQRANFKWEATVMFLFLFRAVLLGLGIDYLMKAMPNVGLCFLYLIIFIIGFWHMTEFVILFLIKERTILIYSADLKRLRKISKEMGTDEYQEAISMLIYHWEDNE